MAANRLRGWLIPMADARRRRGVSAVEPMKPGLAEAARPLSAAHRVRRCMHEPESQAVLCLHICCSPGRAVLTALCISVMLSPSLTDVPEPLLGAYARTTHKIHRRTRCAAESGRAASASPGFIGSTALTPFVCVRPPWEQASRGAGSPPSHHPRMRLQGACDSDGISEARACSCALNVAIDVCLALTRGLEAPCAAEKGANGSSWT